MNINLGMFSIFWSISVLSSLGQSSVEAAFQQAAAETVAFVGDDPSLEQLMSFHGVVRIVKSNLPSDWVPALNQAWRDGVIDGCDYSLALQILVYEGLLEIDSFRQMVPFCSYGVWQARVAELFQRYHEAMPEITRQFAAIWVIKLFESGRFGQSIGEMTTFSNTLRLARPFTHEELMEVVANSNLAKTPVDGMDEKRIQAWIKELKDSGFSMDQALELIQSQIEPAIRTLLSDLLANPVIGEAAIGQEGLGALENLANAIRNLNLPAVPD